MKSSKITNETLLISTYMKTPNALDRLPYTEEFQQIFEEYTRLAGDKISPQELWEHLTSLRKSKKLPRKGR